MCRMACMAFIVLWVKLVKCRMACVAFWVLPLIKRFDVFPVIDYIILFKFKLINLQL